MRVEVVLDKRALRHWHLELLRALETRARVEVTVRWCAGDAPPAPHAVEVMLQLERAIHRVPVGRAARETASAFDRYVRQVGADPDRILDLTGRAEGGKVQTWCLTFDGVAGESAAIAALLSGTFPHVRVIDATAGDLLAAGTPGSESPGVVLAALEDVLAGCIELILAATEGRGSRTAVDDRPARELTRARLVAHSGKSVARAATQRVYRLLYRAPHWRVGWRHVDGPDVIDLLALPPARWQVLGDDGLHFYADPFPFEARGSTHLFVEDFDHRVGRAVISVVEFGRHGPVGVPGPVLAHDVHLSYPCVFEADGQIWMIPESSGAQTVELYRATRFPEEWTLEEVLLDGIEASDVTPFRQGGRWWLSGTVRSGGSFSDALHLWWSERLQGPWTPHARNPVLVDITAARPAGRVVQRNGRLIRPVQDNGAGYGAALALAEITRLDRDGFEQRIIARIGSGPRWQGRRLHTLNRAGGLECIDGSAYSPRFHHPFLPSRASTSRTR